MRAVRLTGGLGPARPARPDGFLALHGVELLGDLLDRLFYFRQQHLFQCLGAPFGAPVLARQAMEVAGARAGIGGELVSASKAGRQALASGEGSIAEGA